MSSNEQIELVLRGLIEHLRSLGVTKTSIHYGKDGEPLLKAGYVWRLKGNRIGCSIGQHSNNTICLAEPDSLTLFTEVIRYCMSNAKAHPCTNCYQYDKEKWNGFPGKIIGKRSGHS